LGPEVIADLLVIARSEALFVIGVNQNHYSAHGFDRLLEGLERDQRISDLGTDEVRMYDRDDHDHAFDLANVVSFRKA
jgi:hypothetical protein